MAALDEPLCRGYQSDVKPSDKEKVDQLIAKTTDWRGKVLAAIRRVMLAADPKVVEEWKWMGTPTWSCDGLIAVANPHKGKVKCTFAYGAKLKDPDHLFNAGLEGNARRAIDISEEDHLDEKALLRLVRSAIEFNRSGAKKTSGSAKAKPSKRAKVPARRR